MNRKVNLGNLLTDIHQDSLSEFELQSNKGIANGYAPLDGTNKVPSINLPSYVDDVVPGYLNPDDELFMLI